jgi:hypothetical protein
MKRIHQTVLSAHHEMILTTISFRSTASMSIRRCLDDLWGWPPGRRAVTTL